MTLELKNGDCLELMKTIPDKSIDLMICDLPYGETNCKWDTQIDLFLFWNEFRRIRKSKRTACIHFCSTKFGYTLIKSWEKGFKMDMVWKKRNKTGGLQSRHRPMRNHEMVYFFYEQAPKYNRDKYHKRIQAQSVGKEKNEFGFDSGKENFNKKSFEPPNPASVVEETPKQKRDELFSTRAKEGKDIFGNNDKRVKPFNYDPPNPASIVEETPKKQQEHETKNYETKSNEIHERTKAYMSGNKNLYTPRLPASVVEDKDMKKNHQNCLGYGKLSHKPTKFEPLQPTSVVEEKAKRKSIKDRKGLITKSDLYPKENQTSSSFEPPNPSSVVEDAPSNKLWGYNKPDTFSINSDGTKQAFTPPNPVSVLENNDLDVYDYIENPEEAPYSVFNSQKVFIGKRHHQTEKPQDILEFFLKYWTDEGETVLDPTMGSGSTGVACKNMKRNFIGFELNEKIFKVAQDRINKN